MFIFSLHLFKNFLGGSQNYVLAFGLNLYFESITINSWALLFSDLFSLSFSPMTGIFSNL